MCARPGPLRAARPFSRVPQVDEEASGRSFSSRRSSATPRFSSSAVPSATIRPRSRTAIRSASRSASSRYWVVRNTVTPPSTNSSTILPELEPAARVESRSSARRGRSPLAPGQGLPRGRAGGACRPSRCRPGAPLPSPRPKRSSSSRARRLACAAAEAGQATDRVQRFSSPVCRASTEAYWPVRLIRLRTSLRCARTSKPATRASPPSASSSVARIRTVVVFPAPFGPSSAKTRPAGDDEREVLQHPHASERLCQGRQFNCRHLCCFHRFSFRVRRTLYAYVVH